MSSLRQPQNFYAGNRFNRLAERRTDAEWLANLLAGGEVSLLPLWQGRSLIVGGTQTPGIALLAQSALTQPLADEQLVFLGEFRGQYCFAIELQGETAPLAGEHGEFHELRLVGGQMDRDEAGLLGYARALLMWRDKHRYCGRCGSANRSINGGHALKCSGEGCGLTHFPRLDPAIIVLVTDGERVLLGRQAQWPAGRYSTIAGYIEWAESVEEAVAREVREEAGVLIDEVEYHSSQPWPFPSSLMLGFIAHAATTEIERTDMELEDARWFTREDIANGAIVLPPVQAVSFRLIESWYDRDAKRPLRDELAARVAGFAQQSK
ncbi:MAG: NAD(+) diphosphatase [Steroidobacteraceae bacterium]